MSKPLKWRARLYQPNSKPAEGYICSLWSTKLVWSSNAARRASIFACLSVSLCVVYLLLAGANLKQRVETMGGIDVIGVG